MLPDNRLDFISNIESEYIKKMTSLRKEFIAIDALLFNMQSDVNFKNEGAARCISLARTKLEEALHYGIKSLCIMGEVKE